MAVTVYAQRRVIGTNRYDYDLKGLSTDPKPSQIYGIDIVENSLFLEMDTGDFYYLKSQGSTSMETLIEEQSFTGEEGEIPNAYTAVLNDASGATEEIKVVFDGVTYSCQGTPIYGGEELVGYTYGATPDPETQTVDWSEYPFYLVMMLDGFAQIAVPDANQHTIEVYTELTVEPVWAKVGSGGSSASNLVGSAVVGTAQAG